MILLSKIGDNYKMKKDIRKLNNDDLIKYDDLINNSIEGTIFHKSWWLTMLKDYYGNSYNVDFYGVFEGEDLISGMPIPIHNKFGNKLIYNPKLTPYLGPFHISRESRNIKKSGEISGKKNINEDFAKILSGLDNCMHYSFHHNITDVQPFQWNGFDVGVHYTYILNLDDLARVWGEMDKTRRHDINKCSREDHDIRLDNIDDFIKLNKKTLERQGLETLSEKLWLIIFNNCMQHDSCKVFTAYKNQLAIASLFLIWDNKRSYYLSGGINNNSEGTMSLLMWEAIKYTKEKLNLREFDFEGSDTRSIEFFFRKFGGDIKPIFSISKNSLKVSTMMKLYKMFKYNKIYWKISGK